MRNIEDMKKLFSDRGYCLLSEEYKGNKKPLIFEKDGYKYQNTYNGFIKTNNPKKWGKNNPFSIENLQRYLEENNFSCELIQQEYDYNNIKLKCKCGNIYCVSLSNLLCKTQYCCPECGRKRSAENHVDYSYLDFIKEQNLIPITEYNGAKNPIFCKNFDGYILKIYPYNLKHTQKTIDRIIFNRYNEYCEYNYKHFIEINNYDCELINCYYNSDNRATLNLKCSCGKQFASNAQWFRKGIGICCPDCSMKRNSSYEKEVVSWLKTNNIFFIKEKTFEGCEDIAPLRFDFYIPSKNLVVEIDGEQHYRPVPFGGCSTKDAIKSFRRTKKHDKMKTDFCKKHGIKLLRISYQNFPRRRQKPYVNILKSHIFG